jgi:hypothetical protein
MLLQFYIAVLIVFLLCIFIYFMYDYYVTHYRIYHTYEVLNEQDEEQYIENQNSFMNYQLDRS